ncbi:MAG TPA: tetratricopeptide repeat protein, partial [Gemmataceae bacterium]|nr:tetratricopeptide repeat protein [Gemmataceae bacterium]
MPPLLEPLLGDSPRAAAIFQGVTGAVGLLALVILWQVFGRGPRRRRGLKRANRRLAAGAWQDALARVRKLRNLGSPSATWRQRLNEAEAACLRMAARLALENKQFEEALDSLIKVAHLVGEPEEGARNAVQSAMLEEIRRLFSVTTLSDNKAVHDLIARAVLVQSPCREASFWQALCFLRGGEPDRAMESLQAARGGEGKNLVLGDGLGDLAAPQAAAPAAAYIDPPLYLGALLLRQGRAKDALKYLTEANRLGGNCPIVTLQLGSAMIAAGGDTQLAVRALQRALGPRGLEMWAREPRLAWVEGFPEGRSYIRTLASAYPFICPLWGADLSILMQQGNLALAQGLYKMASYPEAADFFGKVLQNGAPSLIVLRGLGLSLARLGKYDDAFKHLRIAHEMEEPKDRVTAGYLALCGAKGKPTQPEDKARNILWALSVVTRFNAPGDHEWVALISDLFAEAREEKVSLSLDDQLYACEHLWSVNAEDPKAALAYHHLQATYPQAVRQEYAWLYCRAAQQHEVEGAHALELFARTFADPEPARAFFAEKQWDWGEVEFTYLERAAALDPGHFPAALGPQYAVRGEDLLLARSQKLEQAGEADAALATAEILHKLAPHSPRALDRLAFLYHRRNQPDQAVQLLESWSHEQPRDPVPLVRCAILLHQRGLTGECQIKLREALSLCDGPRRAHVAFLGATLTLQDALAQGAPAPNGGLDAAALATA